jgi:hypothetical protein
LAADLSLTDWLALADIVVLASAGAGFLLMRRIKPASTLDVREAFDVLDRTIRRYVPELSDGFTWGEAFERLKESGIRSDWKTMQERLNEYEAFRYGGKEAPREGQGEIVSLAVKLRRGVIGKGTKAKSAK